MSKIIEQRIVCIAAIVEKVRQYEKEKEKEKENKYGYQYVEKLMGYLGIEKKAVESDKLGLNCSARIFLQPSYNQGESKAVVYYTHRIKEDDLAFIFAHEIGHFILHASKISDKTGMAYTEGVAAVYSDDEEWEANEFAAELLMPAEEFKSQVRNKCKDESLLNDLAKHFCVSSFRVDLRGKSLSLW